MSSLNKNVFGQQSKFQSPSRQRYPYKKRRTQHDYQESDVSRRESGQGEVANALKTSTQNVALDHVIPLPKLSFSTSALLVAILSIATYWNSCHGDFVFDDLKAIVKNQDVRLESPVWNLFQHDFWGEPIKSKESHKSYRPLTVLTFRTNYYLSGVLHPWGFHLVNILLHAVVSALVLPVSSVLLAVDSDAGNKGGDGYLELPRASLLCAILFAVHPIHTENVAGVVGRADLLCALFFFTSFLVYSHFCKYDSSCLHVSYMYSYMCLLLSMALCTVAMLCKEPGITVIGLCSVYDIIINCSISPIQAFYTIHTTLKRHRVLPSIQLAMHSSELRWFRRLIFRQCVLITSAVILMLIRFSIMGSRLPTFNQVDNPASFLENIWLRIINYSYIYSLNFWLLLCPWWLCFDWSMGCIPVIQTPLDPRVVAPIAFWIAMVAIVLYCLFGSDQYERRMSSISISAIIITFLPASNVFFRVGFVIAERVLYLPSLGFCLLVVMATRHLCLNGTVVTKRIVQFVILLIIVCYVVRCYHRNKEWLSERELYRSGLKVCPNNAKVHYNIGKIESDVGHIQEAIHAYREALSLHPDYDEALNNLGNILRDLNQTEEAERLISKAVKIRPTFAAAWMNLGIVQATLNKHKEAETSYLTALTHRKNYPDCYFNLGNLYLEMKQWNRAVRAWESAIARKPDHSLAWFNILTLFDDLGQYETAASIGKEALKHISNEPSIFYAIGNVLGKVERFKEAEEMYVQALHLKPDAANYHGNLGVLYHRWGKLEEAYHQYQRSLALDPSSQVMVENMRKLGRKLKKKEAL